MIEKSPISSVRLGLDAYRKAQGARRETAKPVVPPVQAKREPSTSVREIRSEILRSLQTRSNSGMVSMRDVAVALDHILKRS